MNKLFNRILFFCLLICSPLTAETIFYTPDDSSVFPNPERGFTDEIEDNITDSKPSLLSNRKWYFTEQGDRQTQSLVVLIYYLQSYRTKALSDKMLNGFDTDMQILRDYGFKCVLRFAYTENDNKDATPTQVLEHLAQLKPYLAKNADVIYVLEAGFVGQWGEWYYSTNFGNETQQLNANRRTVLQAILDACPLDRYVLVRYPLLKTQYLGDEIPLTSNQAHNSQPRARIGHHNDAFLSGWGNHGTYGRDGNGLSDDPVLRAYISNETMYVPNGGETNMDTDKGAEAVYANAEKEMSEYHWSFCGAEYSHYITDRWRKKGIYTTLDRRLGYRFQLIQSQWPDNVALGTELQVSISLRNTGFAPLYNRRTVYLVLQSDEHTYSLPLQTDPRTWTVEAGTININESIAIPNDLEAGTYHLYLYLPDVYSSLSSNPRYAIRLANENIWDDKTGMNDLCADISLTSSTNTVIDNNKTITPATKIICNGQIQIIHNNQRYTILGQRVNH